MCLSVTFMESSEAYLISFFLDYRAFSAGVSRRTWFTHVTEIKTVLSIKLPEIAASTADYRSALKWECPKNVSCLRNNLLFVISYIYVAILREKIIMQLCDWSQYLHSYGRKGVWIWYTTLDLYLQTSESLTLQPKSCVFLLPGPSPKGEMSWQMLFKPAKPVNLTMQKCCQAHQNPKGFSSPFFSRNF